MTKKKLNETKQLQEVNNNLKMNVNEATVIKALILEKMLTLKKQ